MHAAVVVLTIGPFSLCIWQVQGCSRIHIVAHSMGNYLLYLALRHRCNNHKMAMDAAADFFKLAESITFAAPDISRTDFKDLLEEVEAFCHQHKRELPAMTLYCSRRDLALVVSSGIGGLHHDTTGRAGFFWRKRTDLKRTLKHGWWGHHVHPFLDARLLTVDATGELCLAVASLLTVQPRGVFGSDLPRNSNCPLAPS